MGIDVRRVRRAKGRGQEDNAGAATPPQLSPGEMIVSAFLSFVGNQAKKHQVDPSWVRALVRDVIEDWEE